MISDADAARRAGRQRCAIVDERAADAACAAQRSARIDEHDAGRVRRAVHQQRAAVDGRVARVRVRGGENGRTGFDGHLTIARDHWREIVILAGVIEHKLAGAITELHSGGIDLARSKRRAA